ncbi:MAG: small nuclear ribonucleoprotein [Candidatus Nanohalarchaeota archaeon]|nr:MAG: small nuclear ribonucleoprotein [Candidatus Nanohaloarchaeota archaeon]
METRPLDVLNRGRDKRIVIILKNEKEITGKLQAFDIHLNMWLSDAEVSDSEVTKKYGKLLVRGDNIVCASPE